MGTGETGTIDCILSDLERSKQSRSLRLLGFTSHEVAESGNMLLLSNKRKSYMRTSNVSFDLALSYLDRVKFNVFHIPNLYISERSTGICFTTDH